MVQVVIYPNMESYIHLSKNRAALLSKYGYYILINKFMQSTKYRYTYTYTVYDTTFDGKTFAVEASCNNECVV